MFGAAARATFALIVFAFELTRDYGSVLPLMLVCVVADAVALGRLRHSIMTEKLARRGLRVASEFTVDVLEQVAVRDVMSRSAPDAGVEPRVTAAPDAPPVVAYADESLRDAVDRMAANGIAVLPVVERGSAATCVGALGIEAILEARRRRIVEERVRQRGWLGGRRAEAARGKAR
jgi:CIC family chloride channel protein